MARTTTKTFFLIFFLTGTSTLAQSSENWAVRGTLGLSLDRGGAAIGLGAYWLATDRFSVGVNAEWNPWFDLLTASLAEGTLNVYTSARWQWLRTSDFNVGSTAHLGTSTLLFSPLGARQFATGAFVGVSFLNLSVKWNSRYSIDFSPELALPVPSLGGVPFAYLQYRMTLGVTRLW